MRNKINLGAFAVLTLFSLMMSGCSFSVGTTPDTAAKTNSAAPANKSASNSTTTAKTEKPKGEKLASEKKPEGKSNKAKEVAVPADWVYVYDDQKGYGFSLPAGSTGGGSSADGVDYFAAVTPAPAEVAVYVFAFKDAKLTKEDLLERAGKALAAMGETVQAGKFAGESDEYFVADATMTNKDGVKSKAKVLVGTDVTDNYIMIVGTTEDKYAANEKIINEIWGSFEMWSSAAAE